MLFHFFAFVLDSYKVYVCILISESDLRRQMAKKKGKKKGVQA